MVKQHLSWFGAAALILGLASACPSARRPMLLVINFDVEDYVTPASEGIDDIPKWLADVMTEEGATGTFFVIGEKARSLEARGRADVITAMARHDIGSHTNFGSIHPTVTEELESADWPGGVERMREQEAAGFRDLEHIFGIPISTLARHGGSYGPQLVCALGEMGKGYSGSPVGLPGHNVAWFCNALNFSGQVDGFDDTYYRDDLFEPHLAAFKKELDGLVGTNDALSFFAGHPTKIRAEQFWDLNYYAGANPGPYEWKSPELRPPETMATARKNFRRLVRYLKSRPDIELATFRDLMRLYGAQKDVMTEAELGALAARVLERRALLPSEDFSPAEAFAGLAEALSMGEEKAVLPRTFRVVHPLGPAEMPAEEPDISRVSPAQVHDLARRARAFLERTGCLPSRMTVGEARIGTGSLFVLFAAAYADLRGGRLAAGYDVPAFEPYPRTSERPIVDQILGYKTWPVHRPDLDMARIVEMTRLELWTLKPARRT
jgi:hypothetical protein